MKRFLSAALLIVSITVIYLLCFRPAEKYRYSDLIISEHEFEKILTTHIQSDELFPEGLTFNQIPLVFDSRMDRWFFAESEPIPSSGIIVDFVNSGNISLCFTEDPVPGKTLRMAAFTETEYRLFELAVTPLPIIQIDCSVTEFTRDPELMQFMLIDSSVLSGNPVTVSSGTIHMRGWSSIKYPKKGLRISLLSPGTGADIKENKTALLGLRNDGDWLLYPAYNDQERVRNVFSSNLWFDSCGSDAEQYGIINGMEYRFAELFLNDEYWGLYALGYPIDSYQMNIHPDNQGRYDEFLYKQQAWGPHSETNPEYDGLILQFDAEQADVNNGNSIMKMYFSQLENGAAGGLYHNDPVNAVDVWLYMKLIQAQDTVRETGKMKNMMFTVKTTDSGRKIIFTPWDMDISWGNISEPSVKNFTVPYALDPADNSFEMTVNPVSVMLQKSDPEVISLIIERYRYLREGPWSDTTISAMLDGFEEDIYASGAYLRDIERWPDSSIMDPAAGLSVFKGYVHDRFVSMDAFISGLEHQLK